MMTALAAATETAKGVWYPNEAGQIALLYAFTIIFTFLGNFWFALFVKRRSFKSWMTAAFKACIAWTGFLLIAIIFPIQLYGIGVGALQNKTIGGFLVTPFLAESISGSLAFGLCLVLIVGYIALFLLAKPFRWFQEA